jgi:hypothetical protein
VFLTTEGGAVFTNLFLLTRTIFFSFWHADWGGAYQRKGVLGVVGEFFCSLVGVNTWPFFIEDSGRWDRNQIQRLLGQHGIKMWGWGHSQGQFFFRVKKCQAHWAQYILLENNVPVGGRLLQSHSDARSASTSAAQKQSSSNPGSKAKAEEKRAEPIDPISVINNFADRLSKL